MKACKQAPDYRGSLRAGKSGSGPEKREAAPQQAAPEPETAKPAGVQAWSARELSEMVLPPIRHVVEGLLPMGMGVLVAKPKLGKSWMVLDLCLAVAQGEPFLGFPTRQHGTLYLALEDGKSRMQTRLRRLLEGRPAPANMHVMFQAQRLGEGLLETLGEYLDANPDIHLVCIDTLSKIKPKAKPFENAYDADYDYMGRLKAFADSRGICVLLVHHTRKSNPDRMRTAHGLQPHGLNPVPLQKHLRSLIRGLKLPL